MEGDDCLSREGVIFNLLASTLRLRFRPVCCEITPILKSVKNTRPS